MMLNNLDHAGGGNWIAGYWLKKRWGFADFEIVDAMREGHLHPKDATGQILTPDQCPERNAMDFYVEECSVNGQITALRFVDLALFPMSEVQAFEVRHGLVRPNQAQEQPHKPSQATTPMEYAKERLGQGEAPGQVMLALVEKFGKKAMPQWRAAGLALKEPIVDLSSFEKDSLKSTFQRHTKYFK